MKKLTFTAEILVDDDEFAPYRDCPQRLAEAATTYGDKHQDWYFHVVGDVTVEDAEDEA